MLRLIAYILFALGTILIIPDTYKKYKENRNMEDLLELIGLILILPSLIILIIDKFIG